MIYFDIATYCDFIFIKFIALQPECVEHKKMLVASFYAIVVFLYYIDIIIIWFDDFNNS